MCPSKNHGIKQAHYNTTLNSMMRVLLNKAIIGMRIKRDTRFHASALYGLRNVRICKWSTLNLHKWST